MEIYDMTRGDRAVIAARLTEKMGVTAPTVWNTVHRMQRDGLVDIDAAKGITLSASGLEAAESIKRRHLLTERLLVDILGLDWADAHEEAGHCRWNAYRPLLRLEIGDGRSERFRGDGIPCGGILRAFVGERNVGGVSIVREC